MTRGFSLLAQVEPDAGLVSLAFDAAPNGRRFDLLLRRAASGRLEVRAATGIVPREGPVVEVPLSAGGIPPIVEMRFDANDGFATILMNGAEVLRQYRGHTQFQESHAGVVSWGVARDDASETHRPSAQFRLVWVEIH